MIRTANIFVYNAINKFKLKEFLNLSVEEATILLPSDGFICFSTNNQVAHYKVRQIIKEVQESPFDSNDIALAIYVFVNKVTNNEYFLLR